MTNIEQKIPEGWSVKKLGECVISTQLGGNYENSGDNQGVPLVKMGNISRGFINLEKIEYLPANAEYSMNDILHYGDILFNTRNTLELVGKVAIWHNELEYAIFNSNILRFTFNSIYVDNNEFMNIWFNSHYALKSLRARATGTTSVAAIYWRDCRNIKILLPPLPEQEKIAEILGTWDDGIEKLSTLIEKKKTQKKALMQKLLTGKNRLKGFTKPWKEVKLGEVLTPVSVRNRNLKISRVLSVTNNKGFVLPEQQFSRVVASEDLSNYKIVIRGNFAYNPSRLNVGSIAWLDKYENGILSPMYVVFQCNEKLHTDYMKQWIETVEFNTKVRNSAQGSVRETVDFKTLSSIKFYIPTDILEQKAIADILSVADEEIVLFNKKLEALKTQKKGLMQQLLTGQIRVKVD